MLRRILLFLFLFHSLFTMAQNASFPFPAVPACLKTPEERADYLALHYWDNVDFTDSVIIGNVDIAEQGFSNFVSIMPYVSEPGKPFEQLVARISVNERVLDYFVAIGEKYLAEPLSPVYNEELYILMLEKVVASPNLSERTSENYKFDLKMASKNRLGTKAADFEFLRRDGKRSRLSKVNSEYVLLFLGDPECDVCEKSKKELTVFPVFMRFSKEGRLKVLSVCVEGKTDAWLSTPAPNGWIDACDEKMAIHEELLYDIPGLPVLYLLDSNHNILLKNVTVQQLENYLKTR